MWLMEINKSVDRDVREKKAEDGGVWAGGDRETKPGKGGESGVGY